MNGFPHLPGNDDIDPGSETPFVVPSATDRMYKRPPPRGDVARIERAIRAQNWEGARRLAVKANLNDTI